MKLVLYNRLCNHEEFVRIMRIVLPAGYLFDDDPELDGEDFIKIEFERKMYTFNRYDEFFIKKVEYAVSSNPYKHMPGFTYDGHLSVVEVDYRFTNKKYYKIERGVHCENLVIHKDLIIDDLYQLLHEVKSIAQ